MPASSNTVIRIDSGNGVFHYDTFELMDSSRRRRREDGALIVPGRLARTGIQTYDQGDGSVLRELRPEDEVFGSDSMVSFDGVSITDLHPTDRSVTPDNFRELTRGHVQNPRRDGDYILADFVVQDGALIQAIESGERQELSAGYFAELDMTPGVTEDGQEYDAIQRRIRANHVAALPRGTARAGAGARFLDSIGGGVADQRSYAMKKRYMIDGVPIEVEASEEAHAVLGQHLDAAAEQSKAAEQAEARADEAEAKVANLTLELADATDPAKATALVEARGELIARARKIAGDEKLDAGGSELDIMLRALDASKVEIPESKRDSVDYVQARFDARDVDEPKAPSTHGPSTLQVLDGINRGMAPIGGGVSPSRKRLREARASYVQDMRRAHTGGN